MKPSRQGTEPEWKQLLHLGEQLVGQSTPASQCDLIVKGIGQALAARVQIWLASPVFPLPGQADLETLPTVSAPALVQKAFQEKQVCLAGGPANGSSRSLVAAAPMIANGNLLGVVQAERSEGTPFRKREISQLEGLVHHAAIAMEVTRQEWLKNWRYEQLNLVRTVTAQIANLRDPEILYSQIMHQMLFL